MSVHGNKYGNKNVHLKTFSAKTLFDHDWLKQTTLKRNLASSPKHFGSFFVVSQQSWYEDQIKPTSKWLMLLLFSKILLTQVYRYADLPGWCHRQHPLLPQATSGPNWHWCDCACLSHMDASNHRYAVEYKWNSWATKNNKGILCLILWSPGKRLQYFLYPIHNKCLP